MCDIIGYDDSLDWKDILKFVNCFLQYIILNILLLLVPYSHQESAIMLSFYV
jgi:hypothetical protein